MPSYLLFESRDPFESAEVPLHCELAARLAHEGNEVTLFLVQNGVFAARRSVGSRALEPLAAAGVRVVADAFSMRERGIPASRVAPGVAVAELDAAIDELVAGCKALWL
jgi:sulfur relay (sulfurtransferase) complex TusBCD TusD component (DsrE family)